MPGELAVILTHSQDMQRREPICWTRAHYMQYSLPTEFK